MIELQIVRARQGQLCLWGLEEDRILDLDRLERQLEAVGMRSGESTRRVLNLTLPGHDNCLVPALAPEPRLLCELLARVADEVEMSRPDEAMRLGPGLSAGASLAFVARLDRFALELIAGGRLLPGLERSAGGWHARWQAAPDGAVDKPRIDLLANAVPGSLTAVSDGPNGATTRREETVAILDTLIDHRARGLLASANRSTGTKPSSSQPSRSAVSPAHAWTKALATPGGEIDAPETELSSLAVQLSRWRQPALNLASAGSRDNRVNHEGDDRSNPAGGMSGQTDESTGVGDGRAPRKLTVTLATRPVEPLSGRSETGTGDEDGRLFALDGLCEFEWRIAVGDQRLTVEELRELAAAQLPLIKSGDRWTVVSPQQVTGALKTIERHGERGRAHAGALLRDSLALAQDPRTRKDTPKARGRTPEQSGEATSPLPPTSSPAIQFEPQGWLRLLNGEADNELAEPAQPSGLAGELRPYQRRGFAWLDLLSQLGLGACLADDMGLGKTIQLLALLLNERERAERPLPPTLLICPVSVVGNWRREARRFAPDLRVLVHHGPQRRRGKAFRAAAAASDLVITSYSIVTRDRDLLGSIAWDRVTLDEAQNIKSRRARQTQAIRALQARHRIALTGTPVENRLTELHSIMDFLNPGLLGSADAFKQQIARPIEQWRDPEAAAQLRQATAPFILRRLKTDSTILPDLPEKIEMRTDCLLTREQASLYQAVVDDLMAAARRPEGIARSGAILAALTRLKQVCNHPGALLGDDRAFANRSGKLARLEEILEEALAEGDRALCFTQFSGFGQRLVWHLADLFDREVLFLHGGSSRQERDEMVERFQADDGPSIFVLSLRAGGTGLNLTAANQVIHFDRWWNPAVEDQATDRAYRIGQKRNVQVRKLTCVGTLEERIDTLLDRKRDLAEMIVGSGESWITELDSAQLRDLVALSPEAVEPGDREWESGAAVTESGDGESEAAGTSGGAAPRPGPGVMRRSGEDGALAA